MISDRVKDGMVKAKLQGTKSGEHIGRKPTWSEDELRIAPAILTANPEISWSELSRRTGIDRVMYAEIPPSVEYSLTEHGKAILPVFEDILTWGESLPPPKKK